MLDEDAYAALQRCVAALRSSQTIGQRLDPRTYSKALGEAVGPSGVYYGLFYALRKGMLAAGHKGNHNVGAELAYCMLGPTKFTLGLGPWGYYTKERDDFLCTLQSMTLQDMQGVLGKP